MFMRSTNQEEQPRYNTLSGRNQAMAQGQGNEQGLITPNSEQGVQSDDEIYIVTPARTPEVEVPKNCEVPKKFGDAAKGLATPQAVPNEIRREDVSLSKSSLHQEGETKGNVRMDNRALTKEDKNMKGGWQLEQQLENTYIYVCTYM